MTPLEQSIEHWQHNAAVTSLKHASVRGSDCALCNACGWDCRGCPIGEAGYLGCEGTPYYVAREHFRLNDLDAFKKAAQEEVDFLVSLKENKQ